MFFHIKRLAPDDPRQVCNWFGKGFNPRQMITCGFGTDARTIYLFEEVLNQRYLHLREIRQMDNSQAWQEACAAYEAHTKQSAEDPVLLLHGIKFALDAQCGQYCQYGFDLGLAVLPTRDDGFLTYEAELVIDIFPREALDQPTATLWPYSEPASYRISVLVGEHMYPSAFYGLITSGAADHLSETYVTDMDVSAWKQRKDEVNETLRRNPGIYCFVTDRYKHTFFNHALNAVMRGVGDRLHDQIQRTNVEAVTEGIRPSGTVLPFTPRSRVGNT